MHRSMPTNRIGILAALLLFVISAALSTAQAQVDKAASSADSDAQAKSQTATVLIKAHGFESNEGQAMIKIYNSDDGFPKDNSKAFKLMKSPIKDQKISLKLTDLAPGNYAILVLHDANGNNEMDTNWIGMPNEPIGISNYPEPARPSFDKAKVKLAAGDVITVNIAVSEL